MQISMQYHPKVINLDSKKYVAAVVVALFCVAAYVSIVSDDTDAASKNYELYVEILGDDHILDEFVYVYFESEADNEKYCAAATKALADAGYSDVTLEIGKYGVSVKYKGDGNNSTWYSDGKSWVSVSKSAEDYINNTKAGAAVNNGWIDEEAYEELPVSEQIFWKEDTYMAGYYQKILEAPGTTGEIKEYKVNLSIINDNLVDYEAKTIKFSSENTATAWVSAFNQATKALGNSIFSKTKAVYALGFVSISYGDNMNTASWVKEDNKWVSVTDTAKQYVADSESDFELQNGFISTEKYNKLSSSEQKNWQETGMGYGYDYQRLPASSSGDNTMLYIIIAVVVIVVIAAAAFFFMKKKSTA